ncbi:phosphodiesterase YfcE [archaeon]|nr:phosphodiesterase YfcE [archaeon]
MKIAVISDVHSNLPALEAVLDETGRVEVYSAGDLVGYNPFPRKTIALFREKRIKSVMGNHDYAMQHELSGMNTIAHKALVWTKNTINREELSYLESLPIKLAEEEFCIFHGSPFNPLNEYVFPDIPEEILRNYLKAGKRDILILGHTHIPLVKEFEEGLILNPGSVGQPRDGLKEASFAFLDIDRREAEIVRVDYPVEETARAIRKAGLPEFLAERLFYGR